MILKKSNMRKIIVIGCPGAGKTTFSKRLGEVLEIPLFHLDSIWHRADRTHVTRDEFDARLGEILELDSWIIDGNYSRTVERRIIACDTVFLFDIPPNVCLEGALERVGKERCDMPWVDTELDPRLAEEIMAFGSGNLPEIYSAIERHGEGKRIVIFKSREEADELLSELS